MTINCVIAIGNFHIKGAFFERNALLQSFTVPVSHFNPDAFTAYFKDKKIEQALISSVNNAVDLQVKNVLDKLHIPCAFVNFSELNLKLDVEEPQNLGNDRIANAYGALMRFPLNDCIIVDVGTVITCDLIAKEGCFLGGMLYPGAEAVLHKPQNGLGKSIKESTQAGIYYGKLGAIERMIAELSLMRESPSSVKVIATGETAFFEDELKDLVDFIDPNLTFVGLYEILKEQNKRR